MDKLEQTQFYSDYAGLDEIRQGGLKNDKQALRKAAEHFESIFMKMMLDSMRKAEDVLADDSSPFNSQTAKFYRGMHDDQLAVNLSGTGALGLADLIVEQLDPESDSSKSAQVYRSDADLHQALNNPTSSAQSYGLEPNKRPVKDEINTLADLMRAEQVSKYKAANANLAPEASKPSVEPAQASANIQFTSKQDFVEKLMPVAEKIAEKLGLPPVAMIAQAALETGWGQKMIQNSDGSNALNFFGIKADNRWQGDKAYVTTLEHRNGVAVQEKAHFRSYNSIEHALDDYTQFIGNSPRYSQAVDKAKDPNAYFSELQNAGYATDPKYAEKIQSILKDSVFSPYTNMLKF